MYFLFVLNNIFFSINVIIKKLQNYYILIQFDLVPPKYLVAKCIRNFFVTKTLVVNLVVKNYFLQFPFTGINIFAVAAANEVFTK